MLTNASYKSIYFEHLINWKFGIRLKFKDRQLFKLHNYWPSSVCLMSVKQIQKASASFIYNMLTR